MHPQQEQKINDLKKILAQEGCRLTGPRLRILKVLAGAQLPMTAADVHGRLRGRSVNLASVYRTLELFSELDILEPVDRVAEGRRYELADGHRTHHHHLICRDCGRTEDFEDCGMEKIAGRIFAQKKFRVQKHELRFLGSCRDCAA